MSWVEENEMGDAADWTGGFVRQFRRADAPSALVRVIMYPMMVEVSDEDWNKGDIVGEIRLEFVIHSKVGDQDELWSEVYTAYNGIFSYPTIESASRMSRRVLGQFKPEAINWDGSTRVMPETPYGRAHVLTPDPEFTPEQVQVREKMRATLIEWEECAFIYPGWSVTWGSGLACWWADFTGDDEPYMLNEHDFGMFESGWRAGRSVGERRFT